MKITNKLDAWNTVLSKANMKVKTVIDYQTSEVYYEVAKYNDNNSFICNLVKKIYKKTGVDMRFSFINISSVMFTTRKPQELEMFVESMEFSLVDKHFAYDKMTMREYRETAFKRGDIHEILPNSEAFGFLQDPFSKDESICTEKDRIVGPGRIVIRSNKKQGVLSDLAKQTAKHIKEAQAYENGDLSFLKKYTQPIVIHTPKGEHISYVQGDFFPDTNNDDSSSYPTTREDE